MRHLAPWIILGAVLCTACRGEQQARAPEAVPVRAALVERKEVPVQVRAVGTVEASISVAVTAQVGGRLEAVHFKEGDDVQAGQLLFTIEQAPFTARVQAQEANLAKAQAEAANARVQLQRYSGLVRKEFVTKEQFDQTEADAKALEATVKAAEAALTSAKLDLGYTEIRAVVSGRTGNLNVKPGNIVQANDQDLPLVTINRIKPVLVRFSVPEQHLPEIRARSHAGVLAVRVRTKGPAAVEAQGELSFIDNAVDSASGTIMLKGLFENEDLTLWPGQFVDIALVLRSERDALVIPSEALQTGQDGTYVWIVRADQTVEIRKVTPAFAHETETVLAAGVEEGERVVTDGQFKLAPNAAVEVK